LETRVLKKLYFFKSVEVTIKSQSCNFPVTFHINARLYTSGLKSPIKWLIGSKIILFINIILYLELIKTNHFAYAAKNNY